MHTHTLTEMPYLTQGGTRKNPRTMNKSKKYERREILCMALHYNNTECRKKTNMQIFPLPLIDDAV